MHIIEDVARQLPPGIRVHVQFLSILLWKNAGVINYYDIFIKMKPHILR